jgi:propionyl-CoA carboxylase alpha chain
MICKLVTYGKDRNEAIKCGKKALDSYVIQGVQHNIPLLRDILTEKSFVAGETTTSYLPRVYPDGFTIPKLTVGHLEILQSVAGVLESLRSSRFNQSGNDWDYVVSFEDQATEVSIIHQQDGSSQVTINGRQLTIPKWNESQPTLEIQIDGEDYILQIHGRHNNGPIWKIGFQGATYDFKLLTTYTHSLIGLMPDPRLGDSSKELLSPMPGVVRSVLVQPGDKVFKGQEVCVIEAMKMQNKLVIGADGIVDEVKVKEGDTVSEEDILIALK